MTTERRRDSFTSKTKLYMLVQDRTSMCTVREGTHGDSVGHRLESIHQVYDTLYAIIKLG